MATVILGGSGDYTVYHGSHRFGKAAFTGHIPRKVSGQAAKDMIARQVRKAMTVEHPVRIAQGPSGGVIMDVDLPDLTEWAEPAKTHPNRNAGWVIE